MDNFVDKVKDVVGKVGNTVENGIKNVSDSSHKLNEKIKLKKKINYGFKRNKRKIKKNIGTFYR